MKSSVCFMRKHVPWPLTLVCFSIKSHNSTVLQISRKKGNFLSSRNFISEESDSQYLQIEEIELKWIERRRPVFRVHVLNFTRRVETDKKTISFPLKWNPILGFSSEFSNGNKKLSHEYTNYFRERVNKKRQK